MLKAIKIFCVLILLSLQGKGQYSDFAVWTNGYVEKKIVKGFYGYLEMQGRINQNATNFYYSSADLGVTFKPFEFLNLSAAYVIAGRESRFGGVALRNQYYASAVLKAKLGRFRLSDRSMFQSKMNDSYFSDESIAYRNNFYRNKLSVKFDVTRKIRPYVAQEYYFELNDHSGNDISRSRSYVGLIFIASKKSQFEVYGLRQKDMFERWPQTDYVLGVGYELYLK